MNFLYELLFKIVSIARGYILCPACSVQNNTYQNRKAPFEESGAATSSEADRQRTKGIRYRLIRIVFIIFIILLCLILAVASPLRCFALGYASETIVELILSSLAGTAAYAFAAAGGAELIACLLIGMGASITVSVIAAAINTAVECGAWEDFVINCQNNFEIRKNQGTMALAMGGTAFLYAYDWVKEHILGIKPGEEVNIPELSQLTEFGSISEPCQTFYDKPFQPEVIGNFSDSLFVIQSWYIGNRVSFNSVQTDVKLYVDKNNYVLFRIDYKKLDMKINLISGINSSAPGSLTFHGFFPIITKDKILLGNHIVQDSNEGSISSLKDIFEPTSYFFKISGYYADKLYIENGSVYEKYLGKAQIKLKYKDGSIRENFSSMSDFIYDLIFKATQFSDRKGKWININFNSTVSSNAVPLENKKYYDKDRDTIATTAGSVRTKVKDGSITSDTDGKVSVKVNSPAIPAEGSAATVTPDTKINESVKVTDISTTLQGVQTMNPGDAITIGSNNIMLNASAYNDKLPFSGLKSISELSDFFLVKSLKDDMPKAPLIPINFTVPVINESIKFDINFACLDPYISLIRLGFAVEFCISMYLSFKKWLMNKEV